MRASARQLDDDRDLALREVQLGEALVVVAGGGDAQVSPIAVAVTPRSAARAKSGRTISSGRTRLAVDVTLPMPGIVRSSRSTAARRGAEHRAVLAGQHQHVLLARAAEADLDARARQRASASRSSRFDRLLA